MAHLASFLPSQVEIGAVRDVDWSTDIVKTDGGYEVRNARWATPLRRFEVSFPTAKRDDPVYTAVVALFEQAQGSLHSFNFKDWSAGGEVIKVRFDSPLKLTGVTKDLDHIETLNLIEVRE
jgi:uncharacterized protein (TIGR02217 family)